ncbi:unnamed protein product [Larinioides sclopetarius]|uniref:Uncharacterized protein n=1 Tax=Larinioides sclopetarius TaxID=280406 RepID=A0AAV1ZIM2_9ARAC
MYFSKEKVLEYPHKRSEEVAEWGNNSLQPGHLPCLEHRQFYVTNPESRNGVICKITSVCTSNSTTFAASWSVCSPTIALVTIDTTSQTEEPLMVINNEPGCSNGVTASFQTNLSSVNSIYDIRILVLRHRGDGLLSVQFGSLSDDELNSIWPRIPVFMVFRNGQFGLVYSRLTCFRLV